MLGKCLTAAAAATMALTATPALAKKDRGVYNSRGEYVQPRRVSSNQVWQGRDGRYYCRRSNGTTGLVIGAAGGALIGRAIDGGRDRTTGTIVGAAAGALLGREVQRGMRCR
jgi:uncharacterized protein YcfJ